MSRIGNAPVSLPGGVDGVEEVTKEIGEGIGPETGDASLGRNA